MGDDLALTLVDIRTTQADGRQGATRGVGPEPELPARHLREMGVEADAALLSTAVTVTPRRNWADGTPGGYLNIIDGRWDVWGEVDRADWYCYQGASGQVEIWFQGLTPSKLWLAVLEVQAWWAASGVPAQLWVGSSDTGPQFVVATFQRHYLGVLFVDANANGSSLVGLQSVSLGKFSFHRATLVDVLG